MLKGINNKISGRKKSKLKLTPGENIRDTIIKAGIKTAEESAYAAGNNTDKLVNISENLGKLSENLVKLSEKLGGVADRGTGLVGGTESATAFGKIAFKQRKTWPVVILFVQDFVLYQVHVKRSLYAVQQ